MIPFNKPFIIGNELKYIEDAVKSGKISWRLYNDFGMAGAEHTAAI